MRRGTLPLLLFIVVLALGAAYVVFWPKKGIDGKLPIIPLRSKRDLI